MADENYDFQALRDGKFSEYRISINKDAYYKNATFALVLAPFKMGTKPTCAFLLFKNSILAKKAYDHWNKNIKDSKIKLATTKAAMFSLDISKADDGILDLTLKWSKGDKKFDLFQEALEPLFDKARRIKVEGSKDKTGASSEDSPSTTETTTEETAKNETPVNAKTAEWEASFNKVKGNIVTLSKLQLQGKVSKVKLEINIKNLEDSVNKLDASLGKVQIVDGAGKVNSLKQALKDIRAGKEISLEDEQRVKKSNEALDTLTGGIGKKAAQLLSKYQDQIKDIEGLADKLESLSKIA